MTESRGPYAQSRAVRRHIVALRQDQGLSTRELADRRGWPRDTLLNYEVGRRRITVEVLVEIAAAFHTLSAALLVDGAMLAQILTGLRKSPAATADVAFYLRTRDEELLE
jgi:transcriptional regulator with XRE-family HTH domain